MSIANFIGNLIWLGIALAGAGKLLDVTLHLRDMAVYAHEHDQIDHGKFSQMMTK